MQGLCVRTYDSTLLCPVQGPVTIVLDSEIPKGWELVSVRSLLHLRCTSIQSFLSELNHAVCVVGFGYIHCIHHQFYIQYASCISSISLLQACLDAFASCWTLDLSRMFFKSGSLWQNQALADSHLLLAHRQDCVSKISFLKQYWRDWIILKLVFLIQASAVASKSTRAAAKDIQSSWYLLQRRWQWMVCWQSLASTFQVSSVLAGNARPLLFTCTFPAVIIVKQGSVVCHHMWRKSLAYNCKARKGYR